MENNNNNTKRGFDWLNAIKILLFLVIGGAVIYVVWYFIIRPLTDDTDGGIFPSGKQEDVDVQNAVVKQSNLTSSQAQSYADSLRIAMENYGTEEHDIVAILSEMNAADYEHVYEKFGKQYYNKTFGSYSLLSMTGTLLTLTDWLKSEFEGDDQYTVYTYLPEVFRGSTSYPGELQLMKAKNYLALNYPYRFS